MRTFTVDDGPVLASTGKSTMCAGNSSSYRCLVIGANPSTIPNGVIGKVTVMSSTEITATPIRIADALGASIEGYLMPISLRIIPQTGAVVSSDCRLHPMPTQKRPVGSGSR